MPDRRASPPGMKYRALQQRMRKHAETADPEEKKFFSAMADGAEEALAQIKQSANLIAESRALLAEAEALLGGEDATLIGGSRVMELAAPSSI